LEDESARGHYVVGDGSDSTVAELTEAAAVAAGAPGAVPGNDGEARARLGDYFAEVLLLDHGTDAAKARAELGWRPSHPGLVEEFRDGSYRTACGQFDLPGTLRRQKMTKELGVWTADDCALVLIDYGARCHHRTVPRLGEAARRLGPS
jgi:hypothetical protein